MGSAGVIAAHGRQIQILGFLLGYGLVYVAVLGPAIGALLPGFEEPAFRSGVRPTGELPSTARGWLMIGTGVPGLFAFLWLRARLAGESLATYWNPDGETSD